MSKIMIAKRLRRFGEFKSGTMARFADELGVSPQTLNSSYLSGRSYPGGELLIRILLLGCDINWLLIGMGRAPNATKEEMQRWIDYCESQVKYWSTQIELLEHAEKEMKALMEGAIQEGLVAEPTVKHRKPKREPK